MRSASAGLISLLAARTPCFKADAITCTLLDGTQDFWTTFDQNIIYSGTTWSAGSALVSRSKIGVRNTLEIPEMDLVFRAGPGFTYRGLPFRQQVMNGVFDGATFRLDRFLMPTVGDTSLGPVLMFLGKKGPAKIAADLVPITVRGGNVLLNQQCPKNLYQTNCLHTFCDSGCTLSEATFTVSKAVGPGSSATFINWNSAPASPTNYTLGKIKMTSGAAQGQQRMIRSADGTGCLISYPFDGVVNTGDTFDAVQGCDKSQTRCTALSNIQHYRGFPYIPPPQAAI